MVKNYSEPKFRSLVLYLAWLSRHDEKFGRTKLNKQLYYCDFLAYAVLGESMTGAKYQRLPNGPAPRRMLPVRKKLESDGLAVEAEVGFYGHSQKRLTPFDKPKLDGVFTAEQVDLIHQVVDMLRDLNGTQISDKTHQLEVGWQVTEPGDTIDYDLVYVDELKPDATIDQMVLEFAAEHAELLSAKATAG